MKNKISNLAQFKQWVLSIVSKRSELFFKHHWENLGVNGARSWKTFRWQRLYNIIIGIIIIYLLYVC